MDSCKSTQTQRTWWAHRTQIDERETPIFLYKNLRAQLRSIGSSLAEIWPHSLDLAIGRMHLTIAMLSSFLGYIPWLLCAVLVVYAVVSTRSKGKPPPGPKPLPPLGNIFHIPTGAAWEVFKQWGQKYGTSPVICQCNTSIFVHDIATTYRGLDLFGGVGQKNGCCEFFRRSLRTARQTELDIFV